MDHETLLIRLMDARARIAADPCPWCTALMWSEGVLTATAVHSVNQDGVAVFAYQGGAPKTTLVSAVFTCQDCGYQVSFTLKDRVEFST